MEANNQDQDQDLDVVKVSPQLSEENTQENSIKKEESPMNMVSFIKRIGGWKSARFYADTVPKGVSLMRHLLAFLLPFMAR